MPLEQVEIIKRGDESIVKITNNPDLIIKRKSEYKDDEIILIRNSVKNCKIESDKLKITSECCGDLIIPIVVTIFQDLTKLISKIKHEATVKFIEDGLRILKETEHKQKHIASAIFSISAKEITTNLQLLVDQSAKIKVTNDTKCLWQEVNVWLLGLYNFTDKLYTNRGPDNLPKRDADKTILACDTQDSLFKWRTGLTKFEIVAYYKKIVTNLKDRLFEFNRLEDESPADIPDNIKSLAAISIEERNDCRRVTLEIPNYALKEALPYLRALAAILTNAEFECPDEDALPKYLSQFDNESTEKKIAELKKVLDKNALTDNQELKLAEVVDSIATDVTTYLNSRYIWQRANRDIAEDIISNVHSCLSRRAILLFLIDKAKQLKTQSSDHLLPSINKGLLEAFNALARRDFTYSYTSGNLMPEVVYKPATPSGP